jgi:hypothetical protein
MDEGTPPPGRLRPMAQGLAFGLVVLVAAGCAGRNLHRWEGFDPASGEAVLVLGLQPASAALWISAGTPTGATWACTVAAGDGGSGEARYARPDADFVVVRLQPRSPSTRYGITTVQFSPDSFYPFRTGDSLATFSLSPGRVTYVGTVVFLEQGRQLRTTTRSDPGRAARYVETHYPALRPHLREGSIELVRRESDACVSH